MPSSNKKTSRWWGQSRYSDSPISSSGSYSQTSSSSNRKWEKPVRGFVLSVYLPFNMSKATRSFGFLRPTAQSHLYWENPLFSAPPCSVIPSPARANTSIPKFEFLDTHREVDRCVRWREFRLKASPLSRTSAWTSHSQSSLIYIRISTSIDDNIYSVRQWPHSALDAVAAYASLISLRARWLWHPMCLIYLSRIRVSDTVYWMCGEDQKAFWAKSPYKWCESFPQKKKQNRTLKLRPTSEGVWTRISAFLE